MKMHEVTIGDKVCARIDGKIRGAEIIDANGARGAVKLEVFAPKKRVIEKPVEDVQLSQEWNNPDKRREL